MTFYSARIIRKDTLSFSMNPFLRGILIFLFLSVLLTFATNMSGEDFSKASLAGKINTFLMPLLLFLGCMYRYSVSFDRKEEICRIRKGLIFLYREQLFSFDDLTALNYRIYDYHRSEEDSMMSRGLPRRSRADFGFFFNGKLVQMEKNSPKKGVEALFLTFTTFFPRPLEYQ